MRDPLEWYVCVICTPDEKTSKVEVATRPQVNVDIFNKKRPGETPWKLGRAYGPYRTRRIAQEAKEHVMKLRGRLRLHWRFINFISLRS